MANEYRVAVIASHDVHYVQPFIPFHAAEEFALKLRRAGIVAQVEVECSPDFPGDWVRVGRDK